MPAYRTLQAAIRNPKAGRDIALMPYLTAGYPTRKGFGSLLRQVGEVADAIELGVPFTDPMADGVTIQNASEVALKQGVNLPWILETVASVRPAAPVVLMSYLNPLLAYGLGRLARDARPAGITGFIVPDLPYEESREFSTQCEREGLALIPLVTPLTSPDRMRRLLTNARGFVYAVTVAGVTGTQQAEANELLAYLKRIRELAEIPVCAGFGIRTRADVNRLIDAADGAIVGSALIERLANGRDPVSFLAGLAPSHTEDEETEVG